MNLKSSKCYITLLGNYDTGYLDSLRIDIDTLPSRYRLVTKYVTDSAKKAEHGWGKWYKYSFTGNFGSNVDQYLS